jgi:hypothetical protein
MKMKATYVLYIKFDDNPLWVQVFDTLEEAEGYLDAYKVSLFDPPDVSAQEQERRHRVLDAHIFEGRTA